MALIPNLHFRDKKKDSSADRSFYASRKGMILVICLCTAGIGLAGWLTFNSQRQAFFTLVFASVLILAFILLIVMFWRRRQMEEMIRIQTELERQVAERTRRIEDANRDLEAFSYTVSHDLRAPLRQMAGFCEALDEDYRDFLDEGARDYIDRIRSAQRRMSELIEDLLQLSRVSRQDMWTSGIDLSIMAREIATELRRSEPIRPVEFVIPDGIRAVGDSRLVRILMENLIGNAFKFTRLASSARIEFSRFDQDGEAVYFVRDNGAGFDMAHADKLFAPFQRLHPEKSFEGTGIGLATVQRIVNQHGGRIWAEAGIGRGATFYFTLPGTTMEEAAAAGTSQPEAPDSGRSASASKGGS